MKKLLCSLLLCPFAYCFSQTTHSVTVQVNQPRICIVVSLEKNSSDGLSVHPNPAKDVINIKNVVEEIQIQIHDLIGRSVFLSSFASKENISIDARFLSRGIYYIRMRTSRKLYQSKIVLE